MEKKYWLLLTPLFLPMLCLGLTAIFWGNIQNGIAYAKAGGDPSLVTVEPTVTGTIVAAAMIDATITPVPTITPWPTQTRIPTIVPTNVQTNTAALENISASAFLPVGEELTLEHASQVFITVQNIDGVAYANGTPVKEQSNLEFGHVVDDPYSESKIVEVFFTSDWKISEELPDSFQADAAPTTEPGEVTWFSKED